LRKDSQFEIVPNFHVVLMEDSKISYPSLKMDRDEKVTILTQNGEVILIFPQSEVQILFS
jgi:hypothetical protein